VLLTASTEGKEIGARLALRLDAGLIKRRGRRQPPAFRGGSGGRPPGASRAEVHAVVATQSAFAASFTVTSAVTAGVPSSP